MSKAPASNSQASTDGEAPDFSQLSADEFAGLIATASDQQIAEFKEKGII